MQFGLGVIKQFWRFSCDVSCNNFSVRVSCASSSVTVAKNYVSREDRPAHRHTITQPNMDAVVRLFFIFDLLQTNPKSRIQFSIFRFPPTRQDRGVLAFFNAGPQIASIAYSNSNFQSWLHHVHLLVHHQNLSDRVARRSAAGRRMSGAS